MKHSIPIVGCILMSALTALTVSASAREGPPHPNLLVNRAEIEAVLTKVEQEEQPWKAAYDNMIRRADKALSQPARSVVDDGPGHGSGGDPNKFSTDAPYQDRDGIVADGIHTDDSEALGAMGGAIRDLALGYAFTRQPEYAEGAIRLLRHWMVDPATGMEPTAINYSPHTKGLKPQWPVEILTRGIGMVYGADLIWDYPGWDPELRSGVADWVRQLGYGFMAEDGGYYNNGEDWRIAFIAAAGALLDDEQLIKHAVMEFKNVFGGYLSDNLVDGQMDPSGFLKVEINRSGRGLSYSMMALSGLAFSAEILRHQGYDLYAYQLPDGRGLARGFDFHAPYVADPDSWPYEGAGRRTSGDIYELAYLWKSKDAYREALDAGGRRGSGGRFAGPLALTHARGAYPWKVTMTPLPYFLPREGEYNHGAVVRIRVPMGHAENVVIRYTLDGSEPDEHSPRFDLEAVNEQIVIRETAILKARAFHKDMDPSNIASATYTVLDPLPEDAFPRAGTE